MNHNISCPFCHLAASVILGGYVCADHGVILTNAFSMEAAPQAIPVVPITHGVDFDGEHEFQVRPVAAITTASRVITPNTGQLTFSGSSPV